MAVSSYTDNDKVLWQAYVNLRSHQTKRRFQKRVTGLKSEAEARREERRLIAEAAKALDKLDNTGMIWGDLVHLWTVEVSAGHVGRVSPRSAEGYFSILRTRTKHWNDIPINEITRVHGRELFMRLEAEGMPKSYQRKVKSIVGMVFEWAYDMRKLSKDYVSPMEGIVIGKGAEKPPQILTLEEIKKLLQAAKLVDHHWYPIWTFAVLTGMRSGELHALTWDQIDLDKGTIMVSKSYDANSGSVGSTKGRYWRVVPINSSLRDLIIEIKSKGVLPSGHVLPRSTEWDNGDQACSLRQFMESIKMTPVKFHTLRACFATQMLANGVSAAIVMKIGGWKKMATMDIYLRLAGVETQGATNCLEFLPQNISFGDNVVNLNERRGT